jgi:hypothetical protein
MIVKCTISVSLKNLGVYGGKLSELPPLPGYITMRGPFIHLGSGGDDRIDTIYEFDKTRLPEAWEIISNHLDLFRNIPGFNFLAYRAIVLSLSKGKQFIRLKDGRLIPITGKEM